jgi:hypothetical protein
MDFTCTLVGEGPLRESLLRQIARAGLQGRVRLAGGMTQGEVARLLAERPIFVHPSVPLRNGMMDGIPVALMEAMAAGAPVLASRLSGIPELIDDGVSGLLVEPGDPEALAGAMRRLAEDQHLAHTLGGAGARRVRADFALDRCTSALVRLLDRHNPCLQDPLPRARAWRRHLGELGPGTSGGCAPVCGARVLHDGPDSRVVEVMPRRDCDGAGVLVVKVHKERPGQSRPPAERARREYELMVHLRSVWPNGGGADADADAGAGAEEASPVPRPLDLDPGAGLLVMEPSPGRRLDELVRSARAGGRAARRAALVALEQTGAWLRRFQEVAAPCPDRLPVLEACRADAVEALERCYPLLPASLRARVGATLSMPERAWYGAGVEVVGAHGDFWPGNVMVVPHGVQVLDFEGFHAGMAFEDAAHFLLHTELFFDVAFLRGGFPALRAAFLRGLGREDLLGLDPYRLCRTALCLRLLAAAGQPRGPAPARAGRVRFLRAALAETWP